MNLFVKSILIIALMTPFAAGISQAEGLYLKKAPVDKDGRFYNPWYAGEGHSFIDLLRWKLSRNQYALEKKKPFEPSVVRPDFDSLEKSGRDWFVWLGHSTVLMRAGGKVIITDPVFWDVNFLVKRKAPIPVNPEELPRIDIVLISHSHYDHLDKKSIKFLKDRYDPFFITGPGYNAFFSSLGITRHASIDWGEEYSAGAVKITSLPMQHWSKRLFSDSNNMLWCSFLIERGNRKYYWVGDSGYFPGFSAIGERYGPIDILFAPIGAYEPRWFMKDNHMDPEEALQAAADLKARIFVPIHWGTFDLTDEPLWHPVKRLKDAYRKDTGPQLMILDHGGAFTD